MSEKFFSCVFEFDIRAMKENPFHVETPYGKPITIARGDLAERLAATEERLDLLNAKLEKSAWQPIESAPKDGTLVLMNFVDGRLRIGSWSKYHDISYPYVWQDEYGGVLVRGWKDDEDPTHWMRLPDAPNAHSLEAPSQ